MIYRPPVAVTENRRNWFSDIAHIYRFAEPTRRKVLADRGGRGRRGHTRALSHS